MEERDRCCAVSCVQGSENPRAGVLGCFTGCRGVALDRGGIFPWYDVSFSLYPTCKCINRLSAMTLGPKPYYWPSTSYGGSPPIATRTGWMAVALLPFVL